MQRRNDRPLNVRALLESLGAPFTIARYRRREALFLRGDACESVMYIEKGRVWLAVTAPTGEEAICGLLAAGAFLGEEALGGDAVRCPLPDVSQEIIAEMVGTTRSRVNLFMGRFKKLGFLAEAGGVVHVHPSLLHVDDSHPWRATRSPVTRRTTHDG